MRLCTLLIIAILLMTSCKEKETINEKKAAFESFYKQSFNLIRENSIKKQSIDWDKLNAQVADSIQEFTSNDKVYDAISYTLSLIADGHSQFVKPNTSNKFTVIPDSIPPVVHKIIGKKVGYLKISGFCCNDSLIRLYTLAIRESLKQVDSISNLSGWIIDLRNNGGGKLSTYPLGLAPLFEDSLIGYAVDNTNQYHEITCTSAYFRFRNYSDSLISNFHLNNRGKKIAVLVNSATASSGEFLALAFKFQRNTKIFGAKTKGKTSHLLLFEFMSNAKLLVANQYYCDKEKKVINGPLIPDVTCPDNESLDLAVRWIENSNAIQH